MCAVIAIEGWEFIVGKRRSSGLLSRFEEKLSGECSIVGDRHSGEGEGSEAAEVEAMQEPRMEVGGVVEFM